MTQRAPRPCTTRGCENLAEGDSDLCLECWEEYEQEEIMWAEAEDDPHRCEHGQPEGLPCKWCDDPPS